MSHSSNRFESSWFDEFCLNFPPGWFVFIHRHWSHYHPGDEGFTPAELVLMLLPGGFYLALLLKILRRGAETSEKGEAEFDKGYQDAFRREVLPLLLERQVKLEAHNLEQLPENGPVAILVNHAGMAFPWDIVALAYLIQEQTGAKVQPLAHESLFEHPFLKLLFPEGWLQALGGVRANRESLKNALKEDSVLIVAPEGARGPAKGWSKRYQVQPFDPAIVVLSRRLGIPLFVVVCVGSEEVSPLAENWEWAAEILGLPIIPISPMTIIGILYPTLLIWGLPTTLEYFVEGEVKGDDISRSVRKAYQEAQALREFVQKRIDEVLGLR